MSRKNPIIDTKVYSVVSINGFRRGGLTIEEAAFLAQKMRRQMREQGWSGDVSIYYRDGTEVNDDGSTKERR